MSEENPNPPAPDAPAEVPAVSIVLNAASPVTLEQAAAWSPAERALIERAAAKIIEADEAAEKKAADEKRKAELHEQSLTGRRERQAKAGAAAE